MGEPAFFILTLVTQKKFAKQQHNEVGKVKTLVESIDPIHQNGSNSINNEKINFHPLLATGMCNRSVVILR